MGMPDGIGIVDTMIGFPHRDPSGTFPRVPINHKKMYPIYAGCFPMGLSVERVMSEMPHVPFEDDVGPKFLRTNALRVLGLDA
jgi:hypothetical protein